MASSITFTTPQSHHLRKSNFLGKTHHSFLTRKSVTPPKQVSNHNVLKPCAKFDLLQILGGRGLCNGEKGVQQELKRNIEELKSPVDDPEQEKIEIETSTIEKVPENGFEKELMGLTGGFPGGEKGLRKFIEENPPPSKASASEKTLLDVSSNSKKAEPPQLPLLMPGMIAIVKNTNSPYYMYCGIVQRITDGKAGVLFEGGNWDRLITFRLEELERREKGPPMKNPRSAILEPLLE